MIGSLDPGQLALAAAKADKSKAAANLIQQAGQRMMPVYQSAHANAVTLASVAHLQVAQGCLTEAAILLLEAVAMTTEPVKVPDGVILPAKI